MCLINWPSWIQAGSAVGIVGLTGATLWVLKGYADDTKRIANVSVQQLENAQAPFLAVIMKENAGGWNIQNQGFGPAINIRHSADIRGNAPVMRTTEPLRAGEYRPINTIASVFERFQVFEMEYESLSGQKYRTTVTMLDNQMTTEFHIGEGV